MLLPMRRCFVLGTSLLFASAAAAEDNNPGGFGDEVETTHTSEIIGGTATKVGQYPTVVALTVGGGICTGTIVSPEWILTAAHCIDPDVIGGTQQTITDGVRVYFNTVDINTSAGRQNVRRASQTIPKPTFSINSLGANDIGLIKLSEPINEVLVLNANGVPEPKPLVASPINFDAAMAPVGVNVAMVGFGATAQGGGGSVGVQFALVNRTSTSCSSFGASNTNLLCFNQTDNKGKCQGDSGGPSFAMINGKQTVVGVTSFGDQNCAAFGADTRTDIEKTFIVQHAPQLEKKPCTMDTECPDMGVCFMGACIKQPFSSGGLGATCTAGTECESGVCADGEGGMKCTTICAPGTDGSCPEGFECLDAGGGQGACWPEGEGGGCCDASGSGAPTALFGIGFVALVLRRRRRA